MSVRNGAALGAAVGGGAAALMIALDNMNLGRIWVSLADFIDRAVFIVCPPYIVGFWGIIPNKAVWFIVAILGNAVLYCALFALVAGVVSLFRRGTV